MRCGCRMQAYALMSAFRVQGASFFCCVGDSYNGWRNDGPLKYMRYDDPKRGILHGKWWTMCARGGVRGLNTRVHGSNSLVVEPDAWLDPPVGGADIALFGVIHGDEDGSEIGQFIFHEKPHSVVVETALNTSHGSNTGNVATLEDCLRIVPNGVKDSQTIGIAQLAIRLQGLPDPTSSSVWKNLVSSNMVFSEHLAYIAAFASNSMLIHGDRPKWTTYRRMLLCPSVVDLDVAFGMQSASNYHDIVSHMQLPKDPDTPSLTERILIEERDAVLLKSLREASLQAGSNALVVGVVGSSHLSGMKRLWKAGTWEGIAAQAMHLPSDNRNESPIDFGVRRALFDGVIRLTCRPDVTYDAASTLGPPPRESMEAYELTSELYGSTRMLLATLDRDQLAEVCSGWRCDPWEFLEPVRNIRPSQGGPGYDKELVLQLRMLNFEIS